LEEMTRSAQYFYCSCYMWTGSKLPKRIANIFCFIILGYRPIIFRSLDFSSEFVAYTLFVNIEMYELYVPCIFLFVTIYVFLWYYSRKGRDILFLAVFF